MRIVYLIKKGLQCYPPCLTQVLTLEDLGFEIIVYHGNNSDFVNGLLDERGIKHFAFVTDRDSKSTPESAYNYLRFKTEARKVQRSLEDSEIVWIGNMETAMSFGIDSMPGRRIIQNVLELYNEGTIYDRWLKRHVGNVDVIIACEKHRAEIMQSRYSLQVKPQVIPNKPYEFQLGRILVDGIVETMKQSFSVVYQGMISRDRPLENVAKALKRCNDENIVFIVMGRCSRKYQNTLKSLYHNTFFTGYISAPEHLEYTKHGKIGIANYDRSSLNNVFCAPNKIYEYSRYGIPVLASDNIALIETVGSSGAGECIDFNNVDVIKESIMKIKSDYSTYSANATSFYRGVDIKGLVREVVERAVSP